MIENFNSNFDNKDNYKPKYRYSDDPEAVKERLVKAMDQSEKMPIPYSKVYEYINEFLEECRNANGTKQISHRVDVIDLKSGTNIILDNGIIAKGCTWSKNEWNNKTHKYERFDLKYIMSTE